MICNMCPRNCSVDREKSVGFCSCPNAIHISKVMFHHWEEPIISGDENSTGSGTIFFSACNLKCSFCQNYEISNNCDGEEKSILEFIDIMKELEKNGALNINLVTPSHYTEQIIEALKIYKPKIPVVWNSSGYEKAEEIEKLKGLVDIYLVDLKYMDNTLAKRFSNAPDYVENATRTIIQMRKNEPVDLIENGLMKRGVIIRHLVLPSCVENSFKCLDFIHEKFGENVYLSLMSQYVPCFKAKFDDMINRPLNPIEYKRVLNHMDKLGFNKGFYQSLDSASDKYIPKFK